MTALIDIQRSALVPDGPGIDFPTSCGELDLHNFARFERFTYAPTGAVELEWIEFESGEFKLGTIPLQRAILCFDGVVRVSLSPQDPAVPRSEENHLEYFLVEAADLDLFRIRFHFVGGSDVDITASKVTALIVPK